MGKKANGEGSVYRRMVKGEFVGYAGFVSLENGERRYFYGKKRQDVHAKVQAALREKKQGTLVDASQQRLEEYLKEWLEHTVKSGIRPRSYERYEQYVRLHIIPILGRIKLQSLTPQHVQTLKSKKLKEDLSPTTVSTILIVLHKALSDAVKLGLIIRNVCGMVSLPRKQNKEMHVLTPSQARELLNVAYDHPNEALFVLALATGMRRGELLGLKWQDIDFTEGVLHVRRVLSRVPTIMGEGAGSLIEAEPKTSHSRRRIVLTDFALAALRKHKVLQEELRKLASEVWEGHDYVFCTPLGRCIHPNTLHNQFRALLVKAGLPTIRFHDLRHSAASLLLGQGVHPKVVQEILGHSQISITMDTYSHVLPSMHEDAMGKLNQVFMDHDDDNGAAGAPVPVLK